MILKKLQIIFILIVINSVCYAQNIIKGIVKDIANDEGIENVTIKNIMTKVEMTTTKNGEFSIQIKKGDLIEVSHISYEKINIRIKDEKNPSYYSLVMRPKTNKLMEIIVREKNPTYKADSIQSYETYKMILEKPGTNEMSMGTGIMANMSNKFREEQAFKINYQKWEKAKYVNYMFNPKQLQKWTGLKGDSLSLFIDSYRPTYDYLRTVNDYNYLLYIKKSLYEFCPSCNFKRK